MSKEIFDKIKEESAYLGIIALVSIIIFKIIFYNESTINVLRIVFSLLWLFGLPGYFLMLHWQESLDFRERFVVGIALAAAVVGISSYYMGLIGINIRYHGFMLPPVIIVIGLACSIAKKNSTQAQ